MPSINSPTLINICCRRRHACQPIRALWIMTLRRPAAGRASVCPPDRKPLQRVTPTTDRWLPHKTTHMKSEPTNTFVKIRNELCNRRALECDAFHDTYKQHLPRLLAVQLYPCGIYKQQFTIKSQHINHEHSSTVPV